jgi:hypothetical protein
MLEGIRRQEVSIMEDKVLRLDEKYSLYKGDFKDAKYYLFNVEDGSIFKLNEVSYTMLSLFDGEKNVGEVLNELKMMYNIGEARLKEDFFNLVNQWLEKEILINGGKR